MPLTYWSSTAPIALPSFKTTIVTVILRGISKALIYTLGSQLPLASKIAHNVLRALCQVDSANAEFYQHRHDSLVQHIDSIDGEIRQILRPLAHRTFMIYHPALGYFARDYGLQQVAVEQDGREPSADRMQQLILQAQRNNVQVIFIQEEHAGRAARRIAESTGARIVSIAPLSVEWDKQMLHIARTLVQPPQ